MSSPLELKYPLLSRTDKFTAYCKSHKANIAMFCIFVALIVTCAIYTSLSFQQYGSFNLQNIQQASVGLKVIWGLTAGSLILSLIAAIPRTKALHKAYNRILLERIHKGLIPND